MEGRAPRAKAQIAVPTVTVLTGAQGKLDGALEAAESACREDDRLYLPRLSLAAVHLAREDQVKAVAAVQDCVRTKPDLDPGDQPLRNLVPTRDR